MDPKSFSDVFKARQHFIDGGQAQAALFQLLTYAEISDNIGSWVSVSEVIEKQVVRGENFSSPPTSPKMQTYAKAYYDGLLHSLKELEYHGVVD